MKNILLAILLIFAPSSIYAEVSKGFYPTGELRYVYKIVNGKNHGTTIEFDKKGNKISEFTYKNGILISIQTLYSTGKVKYKYRMVNGKRHGKTIGYDKNGRKISEFIYKNGVLQ